MKNRKPNFCKNGDFGENYEKMLFFRPVTKTIAWQRKNFYNFHKK